MVNIAHGMANNNHNHKPTKTQETMLAHGKISKYWILLYSEFTINIFADDRLSNNVRLVKKGDEMQCWTNGHITNQIEDLPEYNNV